MKAPPRRPASAGAAPAALQMTGSRARFPAATPPPHTATRRVVDRRRRDCRLRECSRVTPEVVLRAGRGSTMIAEKLHQAPCVQSRADERSAMVAMVINLEVTDYDEWKKLFDSDPGGRKGIATGHTISRNVENPNDVFIRTEYRSVEDAKKVRQQLLDSGALKNSTLKTP